MRSFLTQVLCGIGIVCLRQIQLVSSVPHLIGRAWLELISKMKNDKTAGPSSLESEMVKVAAEAVVDIITSKSYSHRKSYYSRRSYSIRMGT